MENNSNNWDKEYLQIQKNMNHKHYIEEYFWGSYKKLLTFIEFTPNKNIDILELGCGSGYISLKLCQKFNANITLVDFSEFALNTARQLFEKNHLLHKVKFIKQDFFTLKLDQKFDLIHSQGVLEHFQYSDQLVISDIHTKFLKEHGYAIIFVPRADSIFLKVIEYVLKKTNNWHNNYQRDMYLHELKRLVWINSHQIIQTVKTRDEYGILFNILNESLKRKLQMNWKEFALSTSNGC